MESLDQEARLRGLVEKYRKNREKVPLQVLKTRYGDAYQKLKRDILETSNQIACKPPDWMWGIMPPIEAWEIMLAVFKRSFAEAGSGLMLRKALFYSMDADAAIRVAQQMNQEAVAAWEEYLDRTSKIVAWEDESGALVVPRRYSPLLYSFKSEAGWRRLSDGEPAPDFKYLVDVEMERWRPWMPRKGEAWS